MTENKHEETLEHEYDGIRELDNPLPGWWLATFYGTIVFALLYVGYYHLGTGPSLVEELQRDMAEISEKAKPAEGPSGPDESALLAVLEDPAALRLGKEQYAAKCASCHGNQGEGSIGPNLTDAYWIHGDGSITAIATVVSDGVAAKGMPPWKGLLKEDELVAVVGFVKSLKGTKPANAKAPQGELRE